MTTTKKLPSRKTIALIAHDHKKEDMVQWSTHNQQILLLMIMGNQRDSFSGRELFYSNHYANLQLNIKKYTI